MKLITTETKVTICRIGFCATCAKEGRPKTNQWFLLFGSTRNGYYGTLAVHNGLPGFVPHIYMLDKVVGENVFIKYFCAMEGCGTTKFYNQESRS